MNDSPTVTLVIQARMGSTRLPGKMLMPLHDNRTILDWLITRVKNSTWAKHIVVATSNLKEDEAIVNACAQLNVPCHMGSEWDVLSRFYHAALRHPSDIVVRVCGDSPLIDGKIIDFVVDELIQQNVDYFSNGNEPPHFAEDGFCAEAFYFSALAEAYEKAEWLSEREHVTPYIKKNKNLKHAWKQFSSEYCYKLSVDNADDLKQVQWIMGHLEHPETDGMTEILKVIQLPESIVTRAEKLNEGYTKSLTEDRKSGRDESK